jgi:hypothetical protein
MMIVASITSQQSVTPLQSPICNSSLLISEESDLCVLNQPPRRALGGRVSM